MLSAFGSVSGLDMSPLAVAYCRQRLGDKVDVRVGVVPDDLVTADVVTMFDVIEHLEDDLGALRRIHAVLPPGGVLVCTVPAFSFLWSEHDVVNHHFRRYTHRTLRGRLESAGFTVERISYFNAVLFPMIAAVRLLRPKGRRPGRSDMRMPAQWVNRILKKVFAAERFLLRFISLPFGVSLVAVCRKQGDVQLAG
jgi:SAM-dependent methyltransferase